MCVPWRVVVRTNSLRVTGPSYNPVLATKFYQNVVLVVRHLLVDWVASCDRYDLSDRSLQRLHQAPCIYALYAPPKTQLEPSLLAIEMN